MLSLHEGQKVSRSAIEDEAAKRAPTRGAQTGDCGRIVHFGATDLGTHKGCPYGGFGQVGALSGGPGHPQGVPLRGMPWWKEMSESPKQL